MNGKQGKLLAEIREMNSRTRRGGFGREINSIHGWGEETSVEILQKCETKQENRRGDRAYTPAVNRKERRMQTERHIYSNNKEVKVNVINVHIRRRRFRHESREISASKMESSISFPRNFSKPSRFINRKESGQKEFVVKSVLECKTNNKNRFHELINKLLHLKPDNSSQFL
jgi:hypothetical protein